MTNVAKQREGRPDKMGSKGRARKSETNQKRLISFDTYDTQDTIAECTSLYLSLRYR